MIADVIEPFFGINCSGGIGIGKIVKIREKTFASTGVMGKSDPENEVKRLQSAIALYRDLNDKLSRQVDNDLGVRNGDIIRSYLVILDDPEMNELFLKFIRSGRSAEESVSEVCKIFSDMFGRIDDPVISQKKTDIEDIRQTLIGILSGDLGDDREFEKDTVIVGRNITPSLVSKLENGNVVGIVSENGNETSHSAILAKCLKIPMISGVNGIYDSVFDNDTVIVDALDGLVVLAPDEDEYEFYKRKQKVFLESFLIRRVHRILRPPCCDARSAGC